MRRFNAQLGDVGDPFADYDVEELVDAMVKVTWWRSLHARPLNKVAANLRYHVNAEGALVDERIDVTQRLKRRITIFDKLEREPTMELTQMGDIGGVRARLPSLRHVHAVSRRLKKTWTIIRTRDYIENPKPSGYRALHHIVRRDGRMIEVQLRTVRQDAWANQVEEDSRKLSVEFKFGRGDDEIHGYYRIVSEIFAAMDADQPIRGELAEEFNERYARVRQQLRREPREGST
jgi:putative GTP pyrophosphokinase